MATPKFKIKIKGQNIRDAVKASILHVSCDLQVRMASEICLVLNDPNYKITDSKDQFNIGTELDLEIGFGNHYHRLMFGEIISLEPGLSNSIGKILIVRAYDKSFRLRRNKPARPAFLSVRDSDIASQIGREAGLLVEVDQTPIIHNYLQQTGSDWRFLKNRAEANGYELFVQFNTLFFKKPNNSTGTTHILKRGKDILQLNLRLSAVNQPNLHVVRGWDALQKQPLVAKTTPGSSGLIPVGDKLGAQITSDAFGDSRSVTYDTPVLSQDEAENLAKSQFNNQARSFIQGEGICPGKPEMKAGDKLELQNMGERFSGIYYLTRVKHIINNNGYRTKFSIERNAA